MEFTFRRLAVYDKALDFLDKIDQFSEDFPDKGRYLRDCLLERALSIAASIAEGESRLLGQERSDFFCQARGALYQCVCLIELAQRRNLLQVEVAQEVINNAAGLAQMLAGFIKHPGKGHS